MAVGQGTHRSKHNYSSTVKKETTLFCDIRRENSELVVLERHGSYQDPKSTCYHTGIYAVIHFFLSKSFVCFSVS